MDILRTLFLVALAAAGAARAQDDDSTLPPMSLLTLWLPDSEPASLEAVLVSTEPMDHFRLSCPTARSPENDACRAATIYPADVYHSAGPVWGGTTTHGVDDTTTTWVCTLGRTSDDNITWGHFGNCTKTIVSDGSTRTETTRYDPCYVQAHHVPIIVTEGADLLPSQAYLEYRWTDLDASGLNAFHASEMEENGCPASETIMFAGAVETSAGGGEVSDSATSEAPETASGPDASSPTPTSSGEAAAESSEGSDSAAVSVQQLGMSGSGAALVALGILAAL